jgi:hypothetical protein
MCFVGFSVGLRLASTVNLHLLRSLHLSIAVLRVLLQISGALATVLVGKRKTSPTTETKPGKAPKVSRRSSTALPAAGGLA